MNQNEGYVNLGQVVCARGNKGEVALEEWTSGVERFESLEAVEILAKDGRDLGRFEIESAWLHRGRVILKFSGVDDIAEAEKLAGAVVRLPVAERRVLEDGEYFHSDLVGCEVVDAGTGEPLGKVVAFEETGGAGLLKLEGELLIPFARSICVEIDIARKVIRAQLPEGLKELNRR